MNNVLFEQLLYEEESTSLDFKVAQYRFVKATEEEKSELLKDILGFCNAWRRSEAYILIGVEEVRGGRSKVVGISSDEHLDDHSLQQFVNSLTNQPVRFHYEAFKFDEKQVGIIRIEEQTRPIYLKRDYGELQKEKVYVRRGSSTNPQKPASPEEIAKMGGDVRQYAAELKVEFAHLERDAVLGTDAPLDVALYQMPNMETIPDLEPRMYSSAFGYLATLDLTNKRNPEFYREFADYIYNRALLRPVRLSIKNTGQVLASDVRVELTVPTTKNVIVLYEYEMPDLPVRYSSILNHSIPYVRSVFHQEPGEVSIEKNEERFLIAIDCGNLQPGRQVVSDVVLIAARENGRISLYGSAFAGNLPKPENFVLSITVSVTQKSMTVEDLCSLADRAIPDK